MLLNHLLSLLALITGLVISYKAVPLIIKVSEFKRLADHPDGIRKLHLRNTPRLGGVALYGGFVISYAIWIGAHLPQYFSAIVASITILFFVGIKDDINGITQKKKIAGQTLAAIVVIVFGDIKLAGLDGFLGINEFPAFTREIFSILAIVIIVNAYNFIDGADGLASMIVIIGSATFGIWFLAGGHSPEAILNLSILGSLIGFIYYNYQPARIFMGDTGSQLIGFILAISAFRMVQLNPSTDGFSMAAPMIFGLSVMAIPLFDAMRVIVLRLAAGRSPFVADRRHIHHVLMEMGLSHSKLTIYLSFSTLAIIIISYLINHLNIYIYIGALIFMASCVLPLMQLMNYLFIKSGKITISNDNYKEVKQQEIIFSNIKIIDKLTSDKKSQIKF